jgi:hypothetical protein
MNHFAGRCHCGNLEVEFTTKLSINELPLQADQCSFCIKHGARTATDPKGSMRIIVRDSRLLLRYRFGLTTADFLVCKRCGIYVAAILTAGPSSFATLNVNALDRAEEFVQETRAVSYDSETASQRKERRRRSWTPALIEEC